MKRLLLATTAVAGLALVPSANAAEPITVTLGGTFEFYSGWRDTDIAGAPSHDFRIDPEILINTKGVADNGLVYGLKWEVELEGTAPPGGTAQGGRNIRTDEMVGYLSGSWGRLEFGDEDGASDRLAIYAPTVGFAQIDGDYDTFAPGAVSNLRGGVISPVKAPDSDDATKVTYFTPTFAGFQAAVSYAAENAGANEGDSVNISSRGTTYDDIFEGALQYSNTFSGVGVKASGTITHLNGTSSNAAGARVEDVLGWQVGGQLSYAGVTVGGGYVDQGGVRVAISGTSAYGNAQTAAALAPGVTNLEDSWNAGISYVFGPVGVAFNYANADTNVNGRDIDAYVFGASYTVAPGLVVAADLAFVSNDAVDISAATGVQTDDETVFMLGTILTF